MIKSVSFGLIKRRKVTKPLKNVRQEPPTEKKLVRWNSDNKEDDSESEEEAVLTVSKSLHIKTNKKSTSVVASKSKVKKKLCKKITCKK